MDKIKVERINELARLSKARALTDEEKKSRRLCVKNICRRFAVSCAVMVLSDGKIVFVV